MNGWKVLGGACGFECLCSRDHGLCRAVGRAQYEVRSLSHVQPCDFLKVDLVFRTKLQVGFVKADLTGHNI